MSSRHIPRTSMYFQKTFEARLFIHSRFNKNRSRVTLEQAERRGVGFFTTGITKTSSSRLSQEGLSGFCFSSACHVAFLSCWSPTLLLWSCGCSPFWSWDSPPWRLFSSLFWPMTPTLVICILVVFCDWRGKIWRPSFQGLRPSVGMCCLLKFNARLLMWIFWRCILFIKHCFVRKLWGIFSLSHLMLVYHCTISSRAAKA